MSQYSCTHILLNVITTKVDIFVTGEADD